MTLIDTGLGERAQGSSVQSLLVALGGEGFPNSRRSEKIVFPLRGFPSYLSVTSGLQKYVFLTLSLGRNHQQLCLARLSVL